MRALAAISVLAGWGPTHASTRLRKPGSSVSRLRPGALLPMQPVASAERRVAAACRRGCFSNQRDWCQATTAWRPPEKRRVRRASEGLRGIRATDLSRRGVVLLALDHKQFPVRHLYETASVLSGTRVSDARSAIAKQNSLADAAYRWIVRQARGVWSGVSSCSDSRGSSRKSSNTSFETTPSSCCRPRMRAAGYALVDPPAHRYRAAL